MGVIRWLLKSKVVISDIFKHDSSWILKIDYAESDNEDAIMLIIVIKAASIETAVFLL